MFLFFLVSLICFSLVNRRKRIGLFCLEEPANEKLRVAFFLIIARAIKEETDAHHGDIFTSFPSLDNRCACFNNSSKLIDVVVVVGHLFLASQKNEKSTRRRTGKNVKDCKE